MSAVVDGADTIAGPGLPDSAAVLRGLRSQLAEDHRRLRSAGPDEAVIVLGNAAHLLVYAEGNAKYLDYRRLRSWYPKFFDIDENAAEIAAMQLSERAILDRVAADRVQLLRRLGFEVPGRPEPVFQRVLAGSSDPAVRSKLVRTWRQQQDHHLDALTTVVDRMVGLRQLSARAGGYRTATEETFERCDLSRTAAQEFLNGSLHQALASHRRLAEAIRRTTGCPDDDPMSLVGVHLRARTDGVRLPSFPLDLCLDLLNSITSTIFGHTLDRSGDHLLTVRAGDGVAGVIKLDLMDAAASPGRPAAGRHPTVQPAIHTDRVVPIGHLLGRSERAADGSLMVSLDSAYSMFHEFGHALNHVLLRTRRIDPSGMGYLPPERLEELPLWFEKWLYHPSFADQLAGSPDAHAGLTTALYAKQVEFLSSYLQRAAVAWLDFRLHDRPGVGAVEAFRQLDAEFGVAEHCRLADLLGHFSWPMFRANPGANLGYLHGTARSVELFEPFRVAGLTATDIAAAWLDACLDPELPSTPADPGSIARFYEDSPIDPARTEPRHE